MFITYKVLDVSSLNGFTCFLTSIRAIIIGFMPMVCDFLPIFEAEIKT